MENTNSQSLQLASNLLGKVVTVKVDRPYQSKHPKWGFVYECNYGYIEGIIAPDGEELDAYILNVDQPVEEFTGFVAAIIHRDGDDDDKLIVIPENTAINEEQIKKGTEFQEKFFKSTVIMAQI